MDEEEQEYLRASQAYDSQQKVKWTIEEANSNPFHFLQFLTPLAKAKFDTLFTGRRNKRLSSDGKNMKQVYQVTLSAVELDKFEEREHYQDLKVITVFIGDENLDQAYFKPRGLQMKQNLMQRSQNRVSIAENIKRKSSVNAQVTSFSHQDAQLRQ